jgi:tetratricopeptide (TPR) repeat protein
MFKHLFATMNEILDDIMKDYPNMSGKDLEELEEQLQILKAMSDECIENWLLFEEKLGKYYGNSSAGTNDLLHKELLDLDVPGKQSAEFIRGQGFYKLFMYDEAIKEFEVLVEFEPEFLLARIYLAMGYLRKGDYGEAHRHFQFLLPLTEDTKMKAISYNAMGCIQVQNQNLEKAFEYFQKAYTTDPSCMEPFIQPGE